MKTQFLNSTAQLREARHTNEVKQSEIFKGWDPDSSTTPEHIKEELGRLRDEHLKINRKIYSVLTGLHPHHSEVFFAFSQEQLNEGVKELRKHSNAKIYSAEMGMYGTKEGIDYFLNFYENRNEAIKTLCDPQIVYLYECDNHEFCINSDDTEALEIVYDIFGSEGVKKIKRKRGAWSHKTEASTVLEK